MRVTVEQAMICEECEGPIDVPDELFSDTSCCTACGVAYFFHVAEIGKTATRTA